MHMTPTKADETILAVDQADLVKVVLERLKLDQCPVQASDLPEGTALVGGAVRDALLNRLAKTPDLDFVVPCSAINLTQEFTKKIDGRCVILDEQRDMARFISNGWTIDFASQMGSSIEEDLWRRDFSVNAIALTFDSHPRILDPTGGMKDLFEKRLVAFREKNLLDDPLRPLRGIRLIAEMNLSLDSKTKSFFCKYSNLLPLASNERIQAEIQKLVEGRWAETAIRLLKEIGLVELWSNKDSAMNLETFSSKMEEIFSPEEFDLAMPLALLTDLLSDDGLNLLRFSRKQRKRCERLRYWKKLDDGKAFQTFSEKDRLKLHQDLEEDLPSLIIQLQRSDQEIWLRRWRNPNDPLFHPSCPLDGNTLQKELQLSEGVQLGELMRHLCHERAFGRLNSRDEALQSARDWWKHN